MYRYSFEVERINSCDDCPVRFVNFLGNLDCGFDEDGNIGIEPSDITRPDDRPLTEERIGELCLNN